MLSYNRLCLSLLLCILFIITANSQGEKQIEILSTETLSFDKRSGSEARKLIGNVAFKHGNAVMYCDSAYFFSERNIIDAYGNVNLHQGDTLHLYGDYLNYDGNAKLAKIRKKVRLLNKETTLTTEYLDYDIAKSVGYYTNNGNIINGENKLSSESGFYYAQEKVFYFRNKVVIINPKYTINSDTLKYNTVSRVAYFFGPTGITSDNNYIYCENGWYNTKTNISQFNKNAYLKSEKRLLKGDSLYYERDNGIGKAFNNIKLIDSTRNIHLLGNKAFYRENPEYAMITDSTVLLQFNEKDTLFLHADTILSKADSSNTQKFIKAFYHVKFFRPDLQGKCDSLTYTTFDSTMRMFSKPILWHGVSQISADHIEMHLANQNINNVVFTGNAFIASKEDNSKFNQVKGKKMTAYFADGKFNKMHVSGNGQSVYYAKDKDVVIGANKAICSNINLYMKEGKINRIVFLEQPDATFYPLHKIKQEDVSLKGFSWQDHLRPMEMKDIFLWAE